MPIIRSKPLSDQVNEILRSRIRKGIYPAGSKLPSESELSQDFEVSRATIRTVLAKLAAEGLIIRKQGDGTYVNKRIEEVNTHLGGLWEFVRLIENSKFQATIQSLRMRTRPAADHEAHALDLEPGAQVLSLHRLFLADDQPAILATNVIPAYLIKDTPDEADGELHIRDFLQKFCGKQIAYAITEVKSVLAHGEAAQILRCTPQDPLLKLVIVLYDRDNLPLACGESFLDDTLIQLRLVQAWG